MTPDEMIRAIVNILDGTDWDASTLDAVAKVLTDNGYDIREPLYEDDDE